jgi:anti-sigma B factor antagonist
MHIQEQGVEDGVVWHLCGQLTEACSDVLEGAVTRAARHGRRRIVVDLSDVSMVDAGGLGSLVSAYRISTRNLIALSLARVPKRVRVLLTITQLTSVLQIFDSVEQALRSTCASAGPALPRGTPSRLRESAESSP